MKGDALCCEGVCSLKESDVGVKYFVEMVQLLSLREECDC